MKLLPLLALGGLAYFFATRDDFPTSPTEASNLRAFSEAGSSGDGYLAGGNYSNEGEVAAAIMNADDARSALAAAMSVVSAPPPMTTDQLSNPAQNLNYGKTADSPYDLKMIENPLANLAPGTWNVPQATYDAESKAAAMFKLKMDGSREGSDRWLYFKKLYDDQMAVIRSMVVV